MTDLPIYFAAFVVVLGVLIVVHEFGHYLVARLCGVKVLRFSVGFGKALWQRKIGRDQTEWALAIVPLGGYVKMLDEREGEVAPEEAHRAFNRQSVAKRSAIVVAGPLFNLLFAIALYWGLFIYGSWDLQPVLGNPPVNTAAAAAGIGNGEQVRKVDGEPVATWSDFTWMVLHKASKQDSVQLETVDGQGKVAVRELSLAAAGEKGWEGDTLAHLGLRLYRPHMRPLLGEVLEGKAGQRAGLQSGDEVSRIDGEAVTSFADVVEKVMAAAGRPLKFTVLRQGQQIEVVVTPDAVSVQGRKIGQINVRAADTGVQGRDIRVFVRYGVGEAAVRAVRSTWETSTFSLVMLGKMLTGEVSWRNLSGPVAIADYAGKSAKLGWDYYLRFMALVSISLGVLNLLPVPVLDGGHLMYHMIEVVRRRPLSERAMEIGQQIGLSLLLALMALAFFNDINRQLTG